ncbi:hypothetical protein HPB49_005806 [Dermacentor silvarum]|uniref:Uncharacterized protein n=1 Tax=Dermacentor silvarum TaxID=543639 RepID=A0ACB8DW81_DERSI|nr:hypothetical protein HPB49_005806 [Dermacentor silvarum]
MAESKEEMDKYREEARSRHVSKRHNEPSADSAGDKASNTMCHFGRGRETSPPGTRRDFIQAPITSDHGEEAAGSEQVAQSELPVSRQLLTETVQDKALQQRPSPPVCSVMDNGMVHLSNNVNITKDVYDMLMAMPKDSLFVKRAATAIWSSKELARRSFSGMLSSRFLSEGADKAPQKPLTPQKVDALKGK